jgi:endonuclease III
VSPIRKRQITNYLWNSSEVALTTVATSGTTTGSKRERERWIYDLIILLLLCHSQSCYEGINCTSLVSALTSNIMSSNNSISRFFKKKPHVSVGTESFHDEAMIQVKPENSPASKLEYGNSADKVVDELNVVRQQCDNQLSKNCTIEIDLDDKVDEIQQDRSSDATDITPSLVSTPCNPFAQFAHLSASSVSMDSKNSNTTRSTWQVQSNHRSLSSKMTNVVKKATVRKVSLVAQKKEQFVKMKELSVEEQTRIIKKWHSLADPKAPLEVRRYQVLLAARLHARCQEPTVRIAMAALREAIPQGVTVETMADADPEVLAHCISNLQFYNVKAQQVVKAAQEIQSRFGGKVPEDEWSLSQITGIGQCFADLLAFVNTRKRHLEASVDEARQCT